MAEDREIGSERPFRIRPGDIPNRGITFVDHERTGRSGHGGQCLVECGNGDLLAFYSNVSGEIWNGHGVAGWSEYRRSTDGGKTWDERTELPYSKRVWEEEDVYSALAFAAVKAPDDSLILVVSRFQNERWIKQRGPVYLRSTDHGKTWTEARELEPRAAPGDVALTFDAAFTKDDTVYLVLFGDDGNMGWGPYSLYVSEDNGRTFDRRSTLPFHEHDYYVTAGVIEDGDIIVYAYSAHHDEVDERFVPYVISRDEGHTWTEVLRANVPKRIRNPQLSARIGDRYFLHGRSGSYGDNANNFVLYASDNGIDWNEGIYLYDGGAGGDCYSTNQVVGRDDPAVPSRLLIQSSINYDPDSRRVNECHWWVEDVVGT